MIDDFNALKVFESIAFDWDGIIEAYRTTTSGLHPLTRIIPSLSFLFTSDSLGHSPFAYKLHNLMIHCLIGVLIWLFINRLSTTVANSKNTSFALATLTASFWVLHPMMVSTVLYSVQRIAQLSTLFSIGCLLCYLRARQSSSLTTKSLTYFLLFPISLALGLMSKENTVVIFPLLLLFSFFGSNLPNASKPNRLDLWFLRLFVYLPIILGVCLFILLSDKILNYSTRDFNLYERLLNQLYFLAFYIKQFLLPKLSSMGLFFDDHQTFRTFSPALWGLTALHIGLVTGSIWFVKRGSLIALGILFFYLAHGLESSIFPLELAFEHRNYLPYLGLALALSAAILRIPRTSVRYLLASLVIFILFSLTSLRVSFWSSESEWITTAYTFHPNSPRAHLRLIGYLNDQQLYEQRDYANKVATEKFDSTGAFIINAIMFDCWNPNTKEVSTRALDTLLNLYGSTKIDSVEIARINNLVSNHVSQRCTNLDLGALDEFLKDVTALLQKQGSAILTAHVEATHSMINVALERYLKANAQLERSYMATGSKLYLVKSIVALQFTPETLDIATRKFERIMANKQLHPVLDREEIESIQSNFAKLDMMRNQSSRSPTETE